MREELLKFHNTWYSSNIMGFVVLGKQVSLLDQLNIELLTTPGLGLAGALKWFYFKV